MEKKIKCPNCKEETLPNVWFGTKPPTCPKCGFQAENVEAIYNNM